MISGPTLDCSTAREDPSCGGFNCPSEVSSVASGPPKPPAAPVLVSCTASPWHLCWGHSCQLPGHSIRHHLGLSSCSEMPHDTLSPFCPARYQCVKTCPRACSQMHWSQELVFTSNMGAGNERPACSTTHHSWLGPAANISHYFLCLFHPTDER